MFEEKAEVEETALASLKFVFDKRLLPFIPFVSFRALSLTNQASVFVNLWVRLINESVDENGVLVYGDLNNDEKTA